MRGPTKPQRPPVTPSQQFRGSQALYHQQTKNLLVSYSSKKLGFFWTQKKGA
jgi:hypothetical protein